MPFNTAPGLLHNGQKPHRFFDVVTTEASLGISKQVSFLVLYNVNMGEIVWRER